MLAETLGRAGQAEAALEVVTEALAAADRSGERFYAAELHRLRGVACADPSVGRRHDAAASLRLAVAIARQQGALTLERRARASLEAIERG